MWKVSWSPKVEKALKKVPWHIQEKFRAWVVAVETVGMATVRTRKGYHDEPLHGDRKGQRSIRLSQAYRAIYVVQEGGQVTIAEVIEVNKHEY